MTINKTDRYKTLKLYIDDNILPKYGDDNSGHGTGHILSVMKRSLFLVKEFNLDVDKSLVYIIAGYHDIGYKIDHENHEIVSANLFVQDKYLLSILSNGEVQLVKEAIEDHRSKKKTVPRSIYGKILCDADRHINIDDIIVRTYKYIGKYYNPKDIEEQVDLTYNFIKNKNQDKSRVKFYLEHISDIKKQKKLLNLLDKEDIFKGKIKLLNKIKN